MLARTSGLVSPVVAARALKYAVVSVSGHAWGSLVAPSSGFHSTTAVAIAAPPRNLNPLFNPAPTLVVEAATDISLGPGGKNVPGKPPQGHRLNEYERVVRRTHGVTCSHNVPAVSAMFWCFLYFSLWFDFVLLLLAGCERCEA